MNKLDLNLDFKFKKLNLFFKVTYIAVSLHPTVHTTLPVRSASQGLSFAERTIFHLLDFQNHFLR